MLTVAFVMLAEVLIFVPSIARFREDYLLLRLERAQIASLASSAAEDMIDDELEAELLSNAGVLNVVLRRDEMRQLILSSPVPQPIYQSYDLRDVTAWQLMRDALACLLDTEERVIRVLGQPVRDGGQLIEVTMQSQPLRAAMIDYGLRILVLSLVISIITAGLLFFAVRRLLVQPIRGVVGAMQAYAQAPEDARRIIVPSATLVELREAEVALKSMETQLTGALKQKERLAQLGGAVAKISHDLRNILTTAQLFADRMELSDDPAVQRAAPKIVRSVSRAVNLCETTLAFGKAEEPAPALDRVQLSLLVNDVVDSERLAAGDHDISFSEDVPAGLTLRADPEQLFRVISNLIRNARQAIVASRAPGEICIGAAEDDNEWIIRIRDTGPGLPPKAREFLFQPFQGGIRKGGTGLGLAISAELIRGHGGRLELEHSDETGTAFTIRLPKGANELEESL
ncbi:integral membrane sensor signal transduction histidine kinase [Actibacterium atlanticum]|uniref:histidine kinase n=2 Tax=Actibacterium atlanticum TaxID=1461693 RepID=A0A058ZNN4_9RHOB|nr:integral membrane sensor signal transduction histidine kinase [Actibacterium atlanticum]